MMREILLVSETPEVHSQLVRILGASGVQVIPETTLRAAISLLRDPAHVALAVVVEMPLFSRSDFDLLADLSVRHPQVKKIVFAPGGFSEELLDRLQSCSDIHIFSTSLQDPTAARSILDAITPAIASSPPLRGQWQDTTARRSLRVPKPVATKYAPAGWMQTNRSMLRSSCGAWASPMSRSCCMAKQAPARK